MRVRFGDFVFDSHLRELTRGGEPLDLSPKAFALLESLIEARPAPVSKETLYEKLWPRVFVEPGNLHNAIADIRDALEDEAHQVIRTVHRFGYAFTAVTSEDEPSGGYSLIVGERDVVLVSGENVIGRDPAARVVVNSPDVSRHHARIVITGANATIEDLDSKNGTFVSTKRIRGIVPIHDGDAIVIGRTHATLRAVRSLAPTVTAS